MRNLGPGNSRKLWNLACLVTIVVYAIGLFVPLMEPDAAVFAEVAREMYQNHNYFELYKKGNDWLDKPHFQFWVTAFSYKIFGVNAFAYKLPAVLFVLLGAAYTYLFGKRFYSRIHGLIAALLLITSEHIFISNNDVRAEAYMTGLTMMAMYYVVAYVQQKKFIDLMVGSFALACLVMTKGVFTVIPVAAGVFFALVYSLRWKEIFSLRWVSLGILVLIFMLPSIYGHFIQFDLHPEKLISGQRNVSGVKYFLWGSQWGRFTSTRPIAGKGEPLFFFHTLLWAFAPWAILGFFALIHKTRQLIKKNATGENYTYFGFIVLFIIFAFSKFQLSYYLNALFPLLSILTTDAILELSKNKKLLRIFSVVQIVQAALFVALLLVLNYYFAENSLHADTIIAFVICFGIALFLTMKDRTYLKKIIFISALVIIGINYYLNREFYPTLMKYQAESNLAEYFKHNGLPPDKLITLDAGVILTDVMLEHIIPNYEINASSSIDFNEKLVFTSKKGLVALQSLGKTFEIISNFYDYPLTKLSLPFLNKKTRKENLETKYLVRVN